jgi:hypothetical protein
MLAQYRLWGNLSTLIPITHLQLSVMPSSHASSMSSTNKDDSPNVSTMTSGANSSAAVKSSSKTGDTVLETSRTMTDRDGITHTTKTSGKRGASGDGDFEPTSKNTDEDKAGELDKAGKIGEEEGVFAKAGHVFAAVGGAFACVKDSKTVASAAWFQS